MTTVRNAVATRNNAVEQAANQRTPAQILGAAVERQAAQFAAVLPKGMDTRRFSRLVLQACKQAPDLVNCFETQQGGASLLLAATQCAVIGLEPNTPLQQAWLLPRRRNTQVSGKWTKVWECQLSIGYRGLIKLARNSGNLTTIFAEVVHEADEFEWERGLQADVLRHRPAASEDRGPLTHAYAVARFANGGYSFIVLDEFDIGKRRAMSDSWKADEGKPADKQYSPWNKWTDEMWRKSAVRALAPYLDLSTEAAIALDSDERSFELGEDGTTIDLAPLAIGPGDDEVDAADSDVSENGERHLDVAEADPAAGAG